MMKLLLNLIVWGCCFFSMPPLFAEPPNLIPFRGQLTLGDNQEFDGQLDMIFFLVDSPDTVIGNVDHHALWWEPHSNSQFENSRAVQVHRGAFSVQLGRFRNLNSALLSRRGALYVGMYVKAQNEAGDLEWVEIGGPGNRARLLGVPFAISAKEAHSFRVHGNATFHGTSNVSGSTNFNGGLTVNNRLQNGRAPSVFNGNWLVRGSEMSPNSREAAFKIISGLGAGDEQQLRMDGNQISSNRELWIQRATHQPVNLGGGLVIEGDISLRNAGSSYTNPHMQVVPSANQPAYRVWSDQGWRNNGVGWYCDRDGPHIGQQPNVVSERVLQNMGSSSRRACFLTRTEMCALEQENRHANCYVRTAPDGNWYLGINVENRASGYCEARCFVW